ncbi:flavodoxin family protein [Lichenibacterium minor]|uniref:Flavodoxin family protein n=1 Tax=Lichenibacterium minor TaxID=2316528 RepID=A0A4Q2UA97_9HYPH|nr:NAD(P)H-dependent oxidoreductase [Lichenibacterium minor]RYC33789.1 flavodoxin family protein [Lichenibacterium minor]
MKILLVYAHPEPKSLTSSLRDIAVAALEGEGHEVKVSDLYAAAWKSEVDRADFSNLAAKDRLQVADASCSAFAAGALTPDVEAEQDKLLWADALILQFPLWWYAMPAILKGWVDRVYANGFAYGVGEHSDRRWGERFGEGTMAGKRAMLILTAGGWESHYGPRGVNGPLDDLLFPIHHGVLFYPGYAVLPPFVAFRVDRLDASGFDRLAGRLRERMQSLFTDAPIPFRQQNGGDYLIPELTLCPEIGDADASGFALHIETSRTT